MKEKVLAFPAPLLDALGLGGLKGFLPADAVVREAVKVLLAPENLLWLDRDFAEQNPGFKQVIPYCVLRRDRDTVFAYRRTKKAGDGRLRGKWSVGVGGHVNPLDGHPGTDCYYACLAREVFEEVSLKPSQYEDELVGVLYDPSDEVGRVHFGLAHVLDVLPDHEMVFRDEALAEGQWMPLWQAKMAPVGFEGWSALLLEKFL